MEKAKVIDRMGMVHELNLNRDHKCKDCSLEQFGSDCRTYNALCNAMIGNVFKRVDNIKVSIK